MGYIKSLICTHTLPLRKENTMLISFSGYDGSGKTTQINLLLDYYQSKGLHTASIYDLNPTIRYHSYSELIDYYNYFDVIHLRFRLNSDENNDVMNILEYSTFDNKYLAEISALQGFYDYYLLQKYVTSPLLKERKIVISDRHYYDEIAFKSVYGCNYERLCKLYSEIQVPDISFYLKISSSVAYERNKTRPDGVTTLYQNIRWIDQLGAYFDRLTKSTSLIEIDGSHNIKFIHKNILRYIIKNEG